MTSKPSLIPQPCHESWDKLAPEQRGHFCETCETKVWDLSSMTKAEADGFLRAHAGDLCISYRARADGEIVHQVEPVVPVHRLMRHLPAAAGLSLMLAACTPTSPADAPPADKQAEPAKPEPKPEPKPKPKPDPEVKPAPETPPTTGVPPDERRWKGKRVPVDELDEAAPDKAEPPPKAIVDDDERVKGRVAAPDEPAPADDP